MSGEDETGAPAESGEASAPRAPTTLPPARTRASRRGPTRTSIEVSVEVVTPILGGAAQTRDLDEIDVIRPATVRGHLRFWWRALHGHEQEFASSTDLYKAESVLWGCAAKEPEGGRSSVEVRIKTLSAPKKDDNKVNVAEVEGYALWPARAEKNSPAAPRRPPGTRFELTLIAPADLEAEVRDVVRAWLLFGGYGSRTRRGLGSFRVIHNPGDWLPAAPEAITQIFRSNIFSPPGKQAINTPWLAGADLQVSGIVPEARTAWITALGWLKEFRQGTHSRAREPGTLRPPRPSISNWPEADKVRQLSRATRGEWAHRPRHNETPAWPRAGFGLPIVGQFQTKGRDGGYMHEPTPFQLRWRFSSPDQGTDDAQVCDRLASPLIVKALPLASGKFAPCALWLHRAYPAGGRVVLWRTKDADDRSSSSRGAVVPRSAAPFDRLIAPNDRSLFAPLDGKQSLRDAFLDWLHATYMTTRITP